MLNSLLERQRRLYQHFIRIMGIMPQRVVLMLMGQINPIVQTRQSIQILLAIQIILTCQELILLANQIIQTVRILLMYMI